MFKVVFFIIPLHEYILVDMVLSLILFLNPFHNNWCGIPPKVYPMPCFCSLYSQSLNNVLYMQCNELRTPSSFRKKCANNRMIPCYTLVAWNNKFFHIRY